MYLSGEKESKDSRFIFSRIDFFSLFCVNAADFRSVVGAILQTRQVFQERQQRLANLMRLCNIFGHKKMKEYIRPILQFFLLNLLKAILLLRRQIHNALHGFLSNKIIMFPFFDVCVLVILPLLTESVPSLPFFEHDNLKINWKIQETTKIFDFAT